MKTAAAAPLIAIACGGTGGHLFPGLAVAAAARERGCRVALLISNKPIDQQNAAQADVDFTLSLPAVGLDRPNAAQFCAGFWRSLNLCRASFRQWRPAAALAMGGFTSAPAIMAGKLRRAACFLHESNAIPGRANRLLAPWVDRAFVGFKSAGLRLLQLNVHATGTPVRAGFEGQDAAACRTALGLDPSQPVLLITGGSQGASSLNQLALELLPRLRQAAPHWQWLHLAGAADFQAVRAACAASRIKAVVRPFLTEMEWALGAASVAISRAGASSLAELAAARVPSILVPYPHAADNHQFYNARAFAETGAAALLDSAGAQPRALLESVLALGSPAPNRVRMQAALAQWHRPRAAHDIANSILDTIIESASAPDFKFNPEIPEGRRA